jgi:hypothetical protein
MTMLKEEFFKILPPTIYFFVALHLVMFIRVLMLERTATTSEGGPQFVPPEARIAPLILP